jgi:hypothetical protein
MLSTGAFMLKFDIFLPREPFGFEPPAPGHSGLGVLGPLLIVFVLLFVITGGATWFPRGSGVASPPPAPAQSHAPARAH